MGISVQGQLSQAAEDVNCPVCGSDFVEEASTASAEIQRAQPQPQQRPASAQHRMHQPSRVSNNGFTQSVTVSTDAFGNTRTTVNTSRAPSPPMFEQAQPQWTQVGG